MIKLKLQIWESSDQQEELQHFLSNNITYVFGFNRKLLGNKAYKKVLNVVKNRLKLIHKDIDNIIK